MLPGGGHRQDLPGEDGHGHQEHWGLPREDGSDLQGQQERGGPQDHGTEQHGEEHLAGIVD